MNKIFIFFTLLLISPLFLVAQKNEPEKAKVIIIAKAQKNKILLKWAVNQPNEWQKSNQYGFELKKFVFKRNGVQLAVPEPVTLPNKIFKPAPEKDWQGVVEKDNYAAVIAGALYGEAFQAEGMENENDLSKIVNTLEELNQRFSYGLMAADFSFNGAKLAGWAFEDDNVKPNEEYIYQITSLTPKNIADIEQSAVLIGLKNYQDLPEPIEFQGIFQDKNVIMAWNSELLKPITTNRQK